jgi:hypothetical protein
MLMKLAAFDRQDRLRSGILNTIARVFGEVWVFHPPRHLDLLVVAADAPRLRGRLAANPVPSVVEGWRFAVFQGMGRVSVDARRPAFTDGRSPAEVWGDLLFLRCLAAERH